MNSENIKNALGDKKTKKQKKNKNKYELVD
jgi:hypothetical protein